VVIPLVKIKTAAYKASAEPNVFQQAPVFPAVVESDEYEAPNKAKVRFREHPAHRNRNSALADA
jgi:hypothetical protein